MLEGDPVMWRFCGGEGESVTVKRNVMESC